jgi:hypothetical protein
MQKIRNTFLLIMLGMFGFLFTYVPDTLAIPAFARKYDVSCVMCHTAFPKLNDFGNNFRDNGYQMGSDNDLPTSLDKGYFPIAFRTTVGYQYQKFGNSAADGAGNLFDTYTSGFGSEGMDILSAGTLDRDISFLIVPTGEFSNLGGTATFALESAWIRLDNISGSSLLNFKIGYGDLDIPFSTHRSLTIFSPYLIYTYSPTTLDVFALADHQGEAQLMGHTINSVGIFRYAVDLVSNNSYGGHDTGFYFHVTQAMMGGGASSGYRGGIFGLYMPMPTTSNGLTPLTAPIDPTASASTGGSTRPITKYGLDLSGNFLNNQLNVFGVLMRGKDDKDLALVASAQDAEYWGGFVEANYMMNPKLVLIGRYDIIRNTTQADPTINSTSKDQDALTLSARYALAIHNRGEIWVHSELNTTNNKLTAVDASLNPVDQRDNTFFLGLDFAY